MPKSLDSVKQQLLTQIKHAIDQVKEHPDLIGFSIYIDRVAQFSTQPDNVADNLQNCLHKAIFDYDDYDPIERQLFLLNKDLDKKRADWEQEQNKNDDYDNISVFDYLDREDKVLNPIREQIVRTQRVYDSGKYDHKHSNKKRLYLENEFIETIISYLKTQHLHYEFWSAHGRKWLYIIVQHNDFYKFLKTTSQIKLEAFIGIERIWRVLPEEKGYVGEYLFDQGFNLTKLLDNQKLKMGYINPTVLKTIDLLKDWHKKQLLTANNAYIFNYGYALGKDFESAEWVENESGE